MRNCRNRRLTQLRLFQSRLATLNRLQCHISVSSVGADGIYVEAHTRLPFAARPAPETRYVEQKDALARAYMRICTHA